MDEGMSKNPRVSIGLPVYNGEEFIAEALDALLCQSFTDFEIIVCDNASADRTVEISEAFAARDSRIRVYRSEKNLGSAWNFNRAFSLATGEYFKWAAADDVCAPEYLSRCVETLDRNPAAVLAYPKTRIIDERGNVLREYEDGMDLRCSKPSCRFRTAMHAIGECNGIFGLIRADVLRKTSLMGNYVAADRVLLVELSLYGQFHEIPEHLFLRRQHPGSSSVRRGLRNQQQFFDPATLGNIFMYHWKHLSRYWAVAHKAPLRPSEKAHAFFTILIAALYWRKFLVVEPVKAIGQLAAKFAVRV
jgi:glycosyltransferase involved in cell wall biosynthesis